MAPYAVQQARLLLHGPGHAHHPFGIRKLRHDVLCPAQLEIGPRGSMLQDVNRANAIKIIADRPDVEGVVTWLQSVCREAIRAMLIADHAYRYRRAVLLSADHYPFHEAFRWRRHVPCQARRDMALRTSRQ